jgi:hypothetical protein
MYYIARSFETVGHSPVLPAGPINYEKPLKKFQSYGTPYDTGTYAATGLHDAPGVLYYRLAVCPLFM